MTSIDHLAEVARKHGVVVGATTLALGAGFLAGYYFAKHNLEAKINEAAEKEIAEQVDAARKYITVIKREEEIQPETPTEAIERLIPDAANALAAYQGKSRPASQDETDSMVDSEGGLTVQQTRYHRLGSESPNGHTPVNRKNNIWDDAKPHEDVDFDYTEEVRARTEDAPYIISKEEFLENVPDFTQFGLTYFAEDKIMIDEDDDIVVDPDAWVGMHNLRFGHRSEDNRIVYIRNPVFNHDFQVALSDGSYRAEVAGFDPEVGKL